MNPFQQVVFQGNNPGQTLTVRGTGFVIASAPATLVVTLVARRPTPSARGEMYGCNHSMRTCPPIERPMACARPTARRSPIIRVSILP